MYSSTSLLTSMYLINGSSYGPIKCYGKNTFQPVRNKHNKCVQNRKYLIIYIILSN